MGLALILSLCSLTAFAQKSIKLTSPDKNIAVEVSLGDKIAYTVSCGEEVLMKDNTVSLTLGNEVLGVNPKLTSKKVTSVNETITPVVPLKFSKVENKYNQLRMDFRGGYSVEFRAFNDGVAYRFVTRKKGTVDVMGEESVINLPAEALMHMQEPRSFECNNEEPYNHHTVAEWAAEGKLAELPLLIDTKKGAKILLSETGLLDYAGMFLEPNGEAGVKATFPKCPIAFSPRGDRHLNQDELADYIARTDGTRDFPWRYFIIVTKDGQLVESTMACRLAPKSVLADTDWIRPGKVSWEWWNGAVPYGPDVNFVAGLNVETYKYFIDFAAKYGIDYILMDEGWAKSTLDPFTPNPNVDLLELLRYGKEKGVGIVLWLTWLCVENHMDLFEQFAEWGVSGVKIDFMDRSDQVMVNFYEKVAKRAAENHLFVDFHGAYKPAGLEFKYPNVLAYEGVRGMEQNGSCRPENSLYIPFMRNVCGAMDFTPGAMLSHQPEKYAARRPDNASIGTRAYQLAQLIIYETGTQMLADNPTLYYKNAECTEFLADIPVLWDETRALVAEAGDICAVAKRHGDTWYVGCISAENPDNWRELEVPLDFLGEGSYEMTAFTDGINAFQQAMDYRKNTTKVKATDTFKVKVARNGGFAAVIRPQ